MNELLLSIVIPNYNGAIYLSSCIQSVLSQITAECEVILVDDGSTDDSVDLVRHMFFDAIDCGFLKVISMKNSGPGEARNVGVRKACGRYVAFLDSDDFVLPNFIERILDTLSENSPDIIQFNALRVQDERLTGKKMLYCHSVSDGIYDMDEIRADIFSAGKWFPSCRVFAREIILSNPFPFERVFYEDMMTLPFIFFQPCRIYLLRDALTAYRDNPNGTTRNHRPEHAKTMFALFQRVSSLPPSIARDLLRVQMARSIVFFVNELKLNDPSLDELITQVRSINNRRILALYLSRADVLFLQFPKLYVVLDWARKRVL